MTQSPEKLKACPGCGRDSTRVIGGPGTAGGPKYWAGCDYCNWRTWGDTQAEAIAAWNHRTTDTLINELVEVARPFADRLDTLENNCRKLDCGVPAETNVRTKWLRDLRTLLTRIQGERG